MILTKPYHSSVQSHLTVLQTLPSVSFCLGPRWYLVLSDSQGSGIGAALLENSSTVSVEILLLTTSSCPPWSDREAANLLVNLQRSKDGTQVSHRFSPSNQYPSTPVAVLMVLAFDLLLGGLLL